MTESTDSNAEDTVAFGSYEVIGHLKRAYPLYLARKSGDDTERRYVLLVVPVAGRPVAEVKAEVERYTELDHPAIADVVEVFDSKEALVLAFRHEKGATLDRLKMYTERDHERLPDAAIWYLSREVMGALATIHADVERDQGQPMARGHFSAQDVVVSWDGEVRLLGSCPPTTLAIAAAKPHPEDESAAYRAPELLDGGLPTEAGDVYAAAALLWSLLAGRALPAAGRPIAPITKLRKDVPAEVAGALRRALEPTPEKRDISCAAFAKILDRLAHSTDGMRELRDTMEMYGALWALWSRSVPEGASTPPAPQKAAPEPPAPAAGSVPTALASTPPVEYDPIFDSDPPPVDMSVVRARLSLRRRFARQPAIDVDKLFAARDDAGSEPDPAATVSLKDTADYSGPTERDVGETAKIVDGASGDRPTSPDLVVTEKIVGPPPARTPAKPVAGAGVKLAAADEGVPATMREGSTASEPAQGLLPLDLAPTMRDLAPTKRDPTAAPSALQAAGDDALTEPDAWQPARPAAEPVAKPAGRPVPRPARPEPRRAAPLPEKRAPKPPEERTPEERAPEPPEERTPKPAEKPLPDESQLPAAKAPPGPGAQPQTERSSGLPEQTAQPTAPADVKRPAAGAAVEPPDGLAPVRIEEARAAGEASAEFVPDWRPQRTDVAPGAGSLEQTLESPDAAEAAPPPEQLTGADQAVLAPPQGAAQPQRARRGSLAGSLVVAAAALALVTVVSWLWLGPERWRPWGRSAGPPATEPTAATTASSAAGPITSAAPDTSGSSALEPGKTGAPPGSAITSTGAVGPPVGDAAAGAAGGQPTMVAGVGGGDGSELLSYEGYLIVRSSVDALVYLHGLEVGRTNRKLKVRCRQKNLRLAKAPGQWLGPGKAVRVECRSVTILAMEPQP